MGKRETREEREKERYAEKGITIRLLDLTDFH